MANCRIILKVLSGSRAYGLELPQSDTDSRAVGIPSKAQLLGLSPFEQAQDERGDHVVFGIQKMVKLALEGNPNIIELLFTEDILYIDDLGERLRSLRDLFLSRRVAERFGSYALHQMRRLENHYRWWKNPPQSPTLEEFGAFFQAQGKVVFPTEASRRAFDQAQRQWSHYEKWRAERNPARAALEEKFGYDTKHAMHLCRLLKMGLEILTQGKVIVRRPDADWLKGVRQGSFSYAELLELARIQEQDLLTQQRLSTLPEQPQSETVEREMVSIIEDCHWPNR